MKAVGFHRGREPMPTALEDERRRAWAHYRAVLRGRTGREYEELEPVVWEELQRELAKIDERAGARR